MTGRANRFGYFDGDGTFFSMNQAGEYLMVANATYSDESGRLWMGTRRWGGGVASPSPRIVAHGRRGVDVQPFDERRAWFSRDVAGVPIGPDHINFPYQSGDIVWAENGDAVQMRVSVQDPSGLVTESLDQRPQRFDYEEPSIGIDEREIVGELPLVIRTGTELDPSFDLDAIDHWGYAYRAVQRPGVRVRESIGTDLTRDAYWRFDETYMGQWGMGTEAYHLPRYWR